MSRLHPSNIVSLSALLVVGTMLAQPGPASACGPGVHIREATRLLELLQQEEPQWAERIAVPQGWSYLWLGSISPDFQWPIDALGFGHDSRLSDHLLEAAGQAGPAEQLFALGHLAHNTSDSACEMFLTPTLFASAPLGLFDLSVGDDDAAGESESLVEGYGDLLLGNWSGVVDVLYDFWLDSDEAKAALDAIMTWYCEQGAQYTGDGTDCEAVLSQLHDLLLRAEDVLGNMDRQEAHDFVDRMVGAPTDDLLDLAAGGMSAFLQGAGPTPTPWKARDLARLKAGPLADRAFWAQIYDAQLADLGPRLGIDRYRRRPAIGWPGWDGDAMTSGNIESVMRFLPDGGSGVLPGLIIDELEWRDEQGAAVHVLQSDQQGRTLYLWVRLYSARPFDGTLRALVRRDRPGLDVSADDIIGEISQPVAIDPLHYETTPRTELTVPFVADPDGAIGFYAELYVDARSEPAFTTSWDRLWQVTGLEVDRPSYRDNFGTYGHWPPSLPLAEPNGQPGTLFVKVRIAPNGAGIAAALVRLEPDGIERRTADNGLALFDGLLAGQRVVTVEAAEYAPAEPASVTLAALEQQWLDLPLHAITHVTTAGPYASSRQCLPFSWDPTPFGDQAATFLASGLAVPDGAILAEETNVGTTGAAELCFLSAVPDGQTVQVAVRARYRDDSFGPVATSTPIVLDGSPPEITTVQVAARDDIDCVARVPYTPAAQARVTARDSHCPLQPILRWRSGNSEWHEAADPVADRSTGSSAWTLALPADDVGNTRTLVVEVTNAAGLTTTSSARPRPVWNVDHLCPPPPDHDVDDDAAPDTVSAQTDEGRADEDLSAAVDTTSHSSGRDGCQSTGSAAAQPLAMVFVMLLMWLCRRCPGQGA